MQIYHKNKKEFSLDNYKERKEIWAQLTNLMVDYHK